MSASNVSAETPDKAASGVGSPNKLERLASACFCALVLSLAVFQFSENTADPDLWGHIVFGQHMLETGTLPKTEFYSWTAKGQPWINHECVAELALGGAHAIGGGPGVLLLKMLVGLAAFGMALRLGGSRLSGRGRIFAWALGAVAVVEISFGFAARPQIFTALFLTIELALLVRIHSQTPLWALALPFLFVIWVNMHGGVLAGFGLLGLTAVATTARIIWPGRDPDGRQPSEKSWKTAVWLWLGVAASGAALLCNPWGPGLVRWLVESVLWLRPQIQEWNPTPLGWDHAAFFFLIGLTAFVWAFSRRPRALWELVACGAFAVLGLRSVRNAPLFGLVALALVPQHLADAVVRFRHHFEKFELLWSRQGFQKFACLLLAMAGVGTFYSVFKLNKEHPLTMEVPRTQYPVGAVDFIEQHELNGRLLVFFDWGEMAIFHLPECPPSIDGRLDTCYSRDLIAAHWKLYKGEDPEPAVLNPDEADVALLPANIAGTVALAHRPGWQVAYVDDLSAVLVRGADRFPTLRSVPLPVQGLKTASTGRAAFSDTNPRWKGLHKTRS